MPKEYHSAARYPSPSPPTGRDLYGGYCSACHGDEGLGQIALEEVPDILAYLRQWEAAPTWRKPRAVAEMSARAIAAGRSDFAAFRGGCHGPSGRGLKDGPEFFAPALNNPEFLEAASDGFLLASIARGRSFSPMRPSGLWRAASPDSTPAKSVISYLTFAPGKRAID